MLILWIIWIIFRLIALVCNVTANFMRRGWSQRGFPSSWKRKNLIYWTDFLLVLFITDSCFVHQINFLLKKRKKEKWKEKETKEMQCYIRRHGNLCNRHHLDDCSLSNLFNLFTMKIVLILEFCCHFLDKNFMLKSEYWIMV